MTEPLNRIPADASPTSARMVRRVTVAGLVGNLLLAGVKFLFGVLGHSQALVADAVHSVSDMATDVAVLVGVKYWSEPADPEHPYGHGRIEIVIAFLIGIVLAAVGVGLAYNAAATLKEGQDQVPGWLAFATACVSVVAKEGLYRWTISVGHRAKSSAVAANAWHHRSDALSSIPVAVAVLATRINPAWAPLDHVAAVLVAALIIHAAWGIARPAFSQLIDAGATEERIAVIRRVAEETSGVYEVHHVRTRYIGPGLQVDLHILVDPDLTVRRGHDIASTVKRRLLDAGQDVVDVLVHTEPDDPATRRPGA